MNKKTVTLTISTSGVVFCSTESDERVDKYGAFSGDIDQMLEHVRGIYNDFVQNERH